MYEEERMCVRIRREVNINPNKRAPLNNCSAQHRTERYRKNVCGVKRKKIGNREKEKETRLTVQIHHRVGLAPFKVLISRILRPAAGLCRRRVCKHIQHYFPFHLNIAKK